MIKISEHEMFNKKGILIDYDNKKEIFFTEEEAERLRIFLNNREVSLRNRILLNLDEKGISLRDLTKKLGAFIGDVNEELMRLELEDLISLEGKTINHWDLGRVQIPIYKAKIAGVGDNVFEELTE